MFDLKRILKALLFSSSEPLSIKDVQAVITRFHHQQEEERSEMEAEDGAEAAAQEDGQGVMMDLLDQVPSLLTSTQVRDAMAEIASTLEETQAVYRLQEGPHGYRLIAAPEHG
jgi:segregation and condensation protein B